MQFNIKDYLLTVATSNECKELVCHLVEQYAKDSTTKVDDDLAQALRDALLP